MESLDLQRFCAGGERFGRSKHAPTIIDNLYFKRVTPITMKSIPPIGPLKTKFIIINYNNHDKEPLYN